MSSDSRTLIQEIMTRWEVAQEADFCAHQAFPEIAAIEELGQVSAELATAMLHALNECDSRDEWLNVVCHGYVVAMAAAYAIATNKAADAFKPF